MSNNGDDDIRNHKKADGRETSKEKIRKYILKQQQKKLDNDTEMERSKWIASHSHFVTHVEDDFLEKQKTNEELSRHVRPYLNLMDAKDHYQTVEGARKKLFVAEGTETVRVLIRQSVANRQNGSGIRLLSILLKPSSFFRGLLPDVESATDRSISPPAPPFRVLLASKSAISRLAGFPVSRGAAACGAIPDPRPLPSLLPSPGPLRLVALDRVSDPSNLGSILRSAAAFGVRALVLSADCCDPWYRKSVRVSMGHVFAVPVVRVGDLAEAVREMERAGVDTYAAVLDGPDASLEEVAPGERWCCVLGNEADGISRRVREACGLKVRIGIASEVDSLSLPVATGIMLHGLKLREIRS